MNGGTEIIFDEDNLKISALPGGGPRGRRIRFEVGDPRGGVTEAVDLLEGSARRAGMKLRSWIRRQKELRGDTPRGMKRYLATKEANHAAAAR